MYAIKRLQAQRGTWYWQVSFSRGGKRYERRFYEPKHGGTAAARRAAVAWRDETLIQTKALGILEFCERRRGNNTSGAPGVTFSKSARQPDGIWQARLKLDGGRTLTKSFSVRLHGKRKAFTLAVSARRQMLDSAQDRPFVHHALARRAARADAQTSAGVGRGCRVPPSPIQNPTRTA